MANDRNAESDSPDKGIGVPLNCRGYLLAVVEQSTGGSKRSLIVLEHIFQLHSKAVERLSKRCRVSSKTER